MTDWLKRISTIISPQENLLLGNSAATAALSPAPLFSMHRENQDEKLEKPAEKQAMPIENHSEQVDMDENLKALKHLRDLPRGTHVDSRIAGIQNLLGDEQVFKTLKMLRWPQGTLCPRCHSSNVIRQEPPPAAEDQRHHYVCLHCKGEGDPSDFDDFTGLPIESIQALRQWILCWYLIGFCSIHQIAKVLGLSIETVIRMASLGSDISDYPKKHQAENQSKDLLEKQAKKAKEHAEHKRSEVDTQEDYTRSFSKSPTKPGPKSKL